MIALWISNLGVNAMSKNEYMRSSCGCCVMRKRCICWVEPVRVRPRRRCCGAQLEGLCLQLTQVDNDEIGSCCPVIFDEVITDAGWFMDYEAETGVIEIYKRGLYAIDWDIVCSGRSENNCIRFGLEVDGQLQSSVAIPSGTPQQLHGNTLVKVGYSPVKIRLVNTGLTVGVPNVSPIANLRVLACE